MTQPPLVSVLVTARGAAEGLAASLDDALAQDLAPARVEVVVVTDGGGAGAIADGYADLFPTRVRAIAQPGAGALAATSRALSEARGELLAPLEPGDRWPLGRLAAQAAALGEQPEVGLVYSQLTERAEGEPPSGRPVARLLREPPCVAPSSIMLRAALLPALGPLPPELPRAWWWLTVRAACAAEIAWVPAGDAPASAAPETTDGDAARERAAAEREAALREALAVQRWFLRSVAPESPYADAVGEIWRSLVVNARRLLAAADDGDPFVPLLTVTDAERAAAREALEDAREALADGDTWPAALLAARAAALDPWQAPARALLAEALGARPRRATGDPLAGARSFVTLAFAEELLQHRELLAAYGASFDGSADATLAIDASTLLPAAAGRALGALVSDLGLDADGTAHLIAVLAPIDASVRAELPTRADALLTLRASAGAAGAPTFDAGSIDALHALAQRASAA